MTSSQLPTLARNARGTLLAVLMKVIRDESKLAAINRDYVQRDQCAPLVSIKRLFSEQQRQIEQWLAEVSAFAQAWGAMDGLHGASVLESRAAVGGDSASAAVAAIITQHESIALELRGIVAELRANHPKSEAALMLKGLLHFHETSAWMLRLLLSNPEKAAVR